MTRLHMKRAIIAAASFAALSAAAFAQTPAAPPADRPTAEQREQRMRERMQERADWMEFRMNRRLERLKADLKLTPSRKRSGALSSSRSAARRKSAGPSDRRRWSGCATPSCPTGST